MTLALRDYQRAAIDAAYSAEAEGQRRALVVMPTGAGKTVTFAHLLRERGPRGIVLAHRDELVQQAASKIELVTGTRPGIVKAEADEVHAPLIVASVQTLARERRLARLVAAIRGGGLFAADALLLRTLVVDEAHHYVAGADESNTFGRVLEGLGAFAEGGPLVVGFTATPDALTCDDAQLAGGWQSVAYQLGILDGIRAGWLVDIRAKQIKLSADFRKLHTSGGEIRADEADQMLMDADAPEHAARAYMQHASGRKALVFTPTIATAHEFARAFRAHGITAEAVSGETPTDERRAILRRLHTGETMVVCNAQVLTEGFDEPSIGCVIMARPTKSRPFALQCVGRGLRPFPGKSDCIVLDMVGSVARHDLQTVSALFKVRAEDAERGVLAAIAAQAREAEQGTPAGQENEPGEADKRRLVSVDIDLFRGRSAFAWVSAQGRYVLGLGDEGSLVIEPSAAADAWDVFRSMRQRTGMRWIRGRQVPTYATQRTKLYAGLPLDYAQGAAEDIVRASKSSALVDRSAPWRAHPASAEQRARLQSRGKWRDGMTKGEASDALSKLYARRA